MLALFPGTCKSCGQPIIKGKSEITRQGQIYIHTDCFNPNIRDLKPTLPTPPKSSTLTETDILSLMHSAIKGMDSKMQANIATYQQMISIRDSQIETLQSTLRVAIEQLAQTRKVELEIKINDNPPVSIPNAHMQLPDLLNITSTRNSQGYMTHAYLHGAPGGFKTTAARQCAAALNIPFYYMSLDETTQNQNIVGYTAPNLIAGLSSALFRIFKKGKDDFQEERFFSHQTQFTRAYTYGGLCLIDEIDNTTANALTALNTCLENGEASFPWGMVQRHKDFVCIGAGNTDGRNANPQFPDRRILDDATRARFIFMEWLYDWDITRQIANGISQYGNMYTDWCHTASDYAKNSGIRVVLSPREVFQLSSLANNSKITDKVLLQGILRGLDSASQTKLLSYAPFPKRSI